MRCVCVCDRRRTLTISLYAINMVVIRNGNALCLLQVGIEISYTLDTDL